jgi:hypothetical protein
VANYRQKILSPLQYRNIREKVVTTMETMDGEKPMARGGARQRRKAVCRFDLAVAGSVPA